MRPRVVASLVYCGAAFGGAFLFMRLAAPEMPPLIVAFGRVTIAALILLPFAGRERLGALRAHWRDYAVVGFFMAAAPFALFAYAERSLTAGLGSIINATTPAVDGDHPGGLGPPGAEPAADRGDRPGLRGRGNHRGP